MKQKISGFTASGPARPEIRPGDIFRDNYGGTVTIKSVAGLLTAVMGTAMTA